MRMDAKITTLDNGIRVASASMPHVESAAVGVWVGIGSRHEPAEMCGMSHLIEHMLFKGTKHRSARAISYAIEGRGGYLNAFTQEERTCYYGHVPKDHVWECLDILCDMYLHPRFAASDFKKEKGVITDEIMMLRDQPEDRVEEILGIGIYRDHPVGRPVAGTVDTVKAITRGDMIDFKNRHYLAANTVFAFGGNVEHERCAEKVLKLASGIRAATVPKYAKVTSATRQDALMLDSKDTAQSHVALGIRLPIGATDHRRYALRILNVILGENMSSRIFRSVRERHGLAYYVSSTYQLMHETGVMTINASMDRPNIEKGMSLVVRELVDLKRRQVSIAEIKRAKDYAVGQVKLGLEGSRFQMNWVGESVLGYGSIMRPADVVEQFKRVTAEDVMRLAREVLLSKSVTLAIVAPAFSASEEKRLRAITARI